MALCLFIHSSVTNQSYIEMAAWIKLIFGTEATLSRDVGVVTTRTQSNEFRVVTSSNEYLSPRNIVTEYLRSND